MLKDLIGIIFMMISTLSFAQSYKERFEAICSEGEICESEEFFIEWEKAEPDNAEMYVGLFNHYLYRSKAKFGEPNFLGGTIIASENDSIPIQDVLKSMEESDSLFQIAQSYLDKGILKHKDRLDMYIGRSTTLGKKVGATPEFINSVRKIIGRNKLNKGKWLWANNEPVIKTEDEFVNLIQTYINIIFNANTPNIDDILSISELILETYPENYILLSNIGVCKLEKGQYEEAVEFFKRGLQSNPEDIILRLNLADAYVSLNQTDMAKIIYTYIIENGSKQYSEYATKILKSIESKN